MSKFTRGIDCENTENWNVDGFVGINILKQTQQTW